MRCPSAKQNLGLRKEKLSGFYVLAAVNNLGRVSLRDEVALPKALLV